MTKFYRLRNLPANLKYGVFVTTSPSHLKGLYIYIYIADGTKRIQETERMHIIYLTIDVLLPSCGYESAFTRL